MKIGEDLLLHNILGDGNDEFVIQFKEWMSIGVVSGGLMGWRGGVETLCEVRNHEIVNTKTRWNVWQSNLPPDPAGLVPGDPPKLKKCPPNSNIDILCAMVSV